ncbi:MAG: outer membrane beta-barrel protein [Bacteroidota bacterium]
MRKYAILMASAILLCIAETTAANGPTTPLTGSFSTDASVFQPEEIRFDSFDELKKRRRKGGKRGAFSQGNSNISVGYGAPNLVKFFFKAVEAASTDFKATGSGPFHLKYEYGIGRKIGLGVSLAYVTFGFTDVTKDDYTGEVLYAESFNLTNIAALARVNFHFGSSKKFDPYLGVGAGANFITAKYTSTDGETTSPFSTPGFVAIELVFGARYFFSDHIGIYTEVGYAKSLAQLGVTFKF